MNNWIIASVVVMAIAFLGFYFLFARWTGKVDAHILTANALFKEIREDINKLLDRTTPSVIAGSSPIRLTELGVKISNEINAKELAKQIADELVKSIIGKEPYEIQEFCFNYINNEYKPDDDQKNKLQACAYENEIEIKQVHNVLAVELRDILLEMKNEAEESEDSLI